MQSASDVVPGLAGLAPYLGRVGARKLGEVWRRGVASTWWPDGELGQNQRVAAQGIVDQLTLEGFELLGSGMFSLALTHPDWPERVLKIEFGCEQSGSNAVRYWDMCLKWKLRGKTNVHLPEVYATGKLVGSGARCPFVWMKRYSVGDWSLRDKVCSAYRYGRLDDLPEHMQHAVNPGDFYDLMEAVECFGKVDLHDENVMFDPDRNLIIITDPVW